MKPQRGTSDTLRSEEGAGNQRLHNVWFYFHLIIGKAKLIYSDREQGSAFLWLGMGETSTGYTKTFRSVGNSLLLNWGDQYMMGIYVCQNSNILKNGGSLLCVIIPQ